jgi:hypothetical protein
VSDWYESAMCRGVGNKLFFPTTGGLNGRREVEATIRIYCDPCPVRTECERAGENEHGIWGRKPLPPSSVNIRMNRTVGDRRFLIRRAVQLHRAQWNNADIARELGVSTRTVARLLLEGIAEAS